MLINELILNNFRVYSGENRFELYPRTRYGKKRPIILFGGLNGAGKTSILSGVRLALYGRASLGTFTSQHRYEEYLRDSMHRSRSGEGCVAETSVELFFSYAKLGVDSEFRVVRSWRRAGKGVKESLSIYENGKAIKGLNYDQTQNFLNELIPIGVSDLFFFDGEKIAELADETGGRALEGSIKKLLGLDIVERLTGDLTVLNRNLVKKSSHKEMEQSISAEMDTLETLKVGIEKIQAEISSKKAALSELSLQERKLRSNLQDKGGHFSATRGQIESNIDSFNARKDSIVADILLILSASAPISLAGNFISRLESQIQTDIDNKSIREKRKHFEELISKLNEKLQSKSSFEVQKLVSQHAMDLMEQEEFDVPEPVHDLTVSQSSNIFSAIISSLEKKEQLIQLFKELEEIESELDDLGSSLARAPDDAVIKADFDNLQAIQRQMGSAESEIENLRQKAKQQANKALESARRLDKLYEKAANFSEQSRVIKYASTANNLLTEFVDRTAETKIKELERQFTQCFSRLARKDDLNLEIKVDPKTFNVDLLSSDGRKAAKDELSAGEKQIFAISMLEALAKTSGRQLPMIVDTPLGRLDSKHRRKLVEGYFPRASHQMIILSTDTEVDESFYRSLSPDISRAYKLEYDSESGSTTAIQGYFWQGHWDS